MKRTVMLLSALLVSGCAGTDMGGGRPESSREAAPVYIACLARFTDYEADYPWFENGVDADGHEYHGDGSSPRALFRIVSPADCAGRVVGVLYKYRGVGLPSPPDAGAKGGLFSLELPEDFLTGEFVTIENIHVRGLRPEPEAESAPAPGPHR